VQNRTQPQRRPRRVLRVPLRVEVSGLPWPAVDEYAINLSCNGMCLQTAEPGKQGERLTLSFSLAPKSRTIRTEAEIAWVTCEEDRVPCMHFYEMGVRFLELGDQEHEEIARFVENTVNYWLDEHEPEGAESPNGLSTG
jgi:uncharacterized protein (TIGR02266 family)